MRVPALKVSASQNSREGRIKSGPVWQAPIGLPDLLQPCGVDLHFDLAYLSILGDSVYLGLQRCDATMARKRENYCLLQNDNFFFQIPFGSGRVNLQSLKLDQ